MVNEKISFKIKIKIKIKVNVKFKFKIKVNVIGTTAIEGKGLLLQN